MMMIMMIICNIKKDDMPLCSTVRAKLLNEPQFQGFS